MTINIEDIRTELRALRPVSAWNKGVKLYALDLVDELAEAIESGYFVEENLSDPKLLKRQMLKGAETWLEYAEGGCGLTYDADIAERLCTPSELRRNRSGELPPNSRETWLQVEARALFQAERLIKRIAHR